MALRCVYTDLDGTLLGAGASLFSDEEGNFSMSQARALEACARSRPRVEVVIMSGRRRVQVHEDARILGQSSFIFEVGAAFSMEGEITPVTGDFELEPGKTVVEQMDERGVPELLIESFRGRFEAHEPWHVEREWSHLFRGYVDPVEANSVLEQNGHGDLRLLDNGAIHRKMKGIEQAHCYHLVPKGVSKGRAVAAHARARGYAPEETIAVGDSIEDLEVAPAVGRFFVVANGPEKDPALGEAMSRFPNASVTEARNGAGVYEAVVTSLMET